MVAASVLSKPRMKPTLELSEKSIFVVAPFSAIKFVSDSGVEVVGLGFVAVSRLQFVGAGPVRLKSTPMSAACNTSGCKRRTEITIAIGSWFL